jgi:hypothetical protein
MTLLKDDAMARGRQLGDIRRDPARNTATVSPAPH